MYMRSSVYETVERPSVRPSVRLSHRSTAAAVCGGFAADRLLHDAPVAGVPRCGLRAAGAGTEQQQRCSTALSSKCGQCHVDSRGTRLNLDLFTKS